MADLKKLLGKRIKEIRIARNLTQEELSELTNIGASSISKIESGYFHPTDENLDKIASALKVEPYKLYMFNHQKDIPELTKSIKAMIEMADEQEIRLIYKILNGILY